VLASLRERICVNCRLDIAFLFPSCLNLRRFILAGLILVLSAFPTYSIGIRPTRHIFVSSHNKVCDGEFLVVNSRDEDMQVRVEISNGVKSNENEFLPPAKEWLNVDETDFVIGPEQKKNVHFQLTVPTSTAGMFSARISFVDVSQSGFSTAMTAPVYVIIKGTELLDWSVEELIVKNTPVGLSGSFMVENRGNVMFYANGRFVVRDRKGRDVYSTEAGGGNIIYPQRKTQIPLNVKQMNLKPGKYVAEIKIAGYDNIEKAFRFRIRRTRQGKYEIKN